MTLDPRWIDVLMVAGLAFSIGVGLWNVIKIREIHLSMNSRLDQLLASSAGEAHAAGVIEERAREAASKAALLRQGERDVSQSRLEEGQKATLT